MLYEPDLDHELFFDDDREAKETTRIRNAFIVDGMVKHPTEALPTPDNVTAWARAKRKAMAMLGSDTNSRSAKRFTAAARTDLHHKKDYCPCIDVTEEYLKTHEH